MKNLKHLILLALAMTSLTICGSAQTNEKTSNPYYDAALAKKLGADEYGMKSYVLVILKTGPKDAEFKGKERDDIFAGHMANIGRLAEAGKLAVAGPFMKNDKGYRGLYIFNAKIIFFGAINQVLQMLFKKIFLNSLKFFNFFSLNHLNFWNY